MKITVIMPLGVAREALEWFGLKTEPVGEIQVNRTKIRVNSGLVSFEVGSYLDHFGQLESQRRPGEMSVYLYDEIPLDSGQLYPEPGIYETSTGQYLLVVSARWTPGGTVISIEGNFHFHSPSEVRRLWVLLRSGGDHGLKRTVSFTPPS